VINQSWFLILGKVVLWAALIMTIISGVQYVKDNIQVFKK
jgi:hypothetical protein